MKLISHFAGGKTSTKEIDRMKSQFNDIAKQALIDSRKMIANQFRVTCLSEKFDSPLMWSHYANKHFGFCLEYDFTATMIERRYPDLLTAQLMLFPVTYSEERPLISKALFNSRVKLDYLKTKKLPPNFIKDMMLGLLYKSNDWEYEKEWRIFQINPKNITMKLPPARKLFLGANIEEKPRERLINIAKKKHIPIYQMFLTMDKFKFDYYEVT